MGSDDSTPSRFLLCVAAKLLYTVPGLNGEQAISCIAEGGYTAALGHGGMEGKVKLWDLKTGVCCFDVRVAIPDHAMPCCIMPHCILGAGIAQWLERQTHD